MPAPGRPILVVDDDQGVRDAMNVLLTMAGYEVHLAENGQAALDCIERRRPSLVLLDMRMPVLDGWGFVLRAAPSIEAR
jgi:CheY-like chemotaxis protein